MDIKHQDLKHYESNTLTGRMWQESLEIQEQIAELTFIKQLSSGDLSKADFNRYLSQDVIYLRAYSKALALLSSRAQDNTAAAFWAASARTAIVAEAQLHRETLGLGIDEIPDQASPECLGYSSFLIATAATEPYAVAAAAALPCFWLYADVSAKIFAAASAVDGALDRNPHRAWVENYANPIFQEEAAAACELINQAAQSATSAQQELMVAAFLQSCRYELMFWRQGTDPQNWS